MGKWIGCLMVAAVAAGAVADDWYTWRGPTADGISKETGLKPTSAKKIWTKELGVGYSAVGVKDGRLYTMGHADGVDTVYCLEAATGATIWNYSYDCETGKYKGPRATPVINDGKVYTVSRTGLLICFDEGSGKKRWETDVLAETNNKDSRWGWGISTSAVIEGDLILLNIGAAGTAVDKHTGKIKWTSSGLQSYASPVVFNHRGKRLAAIFSAPGLLLVDAQTGAEAGRYEWKTKYDINGADPVIIGDRIYISSAYKSGCAMLDFSSGKLEPLWESDLMNNQFSTSIHIDGYIYGVDGHVKNKGFLRCVDAKDGAEQWSKPIGFGSLIAADGQLIVLDEKGTLIFAKIDPEKYIEVATFETGLAKLCWTPPVLANGIVYCRNDKGTLVAIDVSQ
ncbi:PQQ-binding-like beta-propeller repeat protein [Pontiella sp.]|uniref:outer membrane protein assembly factor BamB family protein n=1 Tax=Pontiella sp. TaxID=2837462 RepID=UPI0035655BFB